MTRRLPALLGWSALLGLLGCTTAPRVVPFPGKGADSGGAVYSEDSGDTIEPMALTWALDWAVHEATPLPDGGLRLSREDGLTVNILTGWVVLWNLVAEPCETPPSPPPHGYDDHPSALPEAVAVALHARQSGLLGPPVAVDPDRFCEVGITHYIASDTTLGRPESGSLDGWTIQLDGTLTRGPDAEPEPFSWHTDLSVELDVLLPEPLELDAPTRITVTLTPDHLLDSVDLDDHPERVALDVLTQLARTATTTVSRSDQ